MPKAAANGLELEYETFGSAGDPAILLIMGLGGQLTVWPEQFCHQLAEAGFYVIRYDNRDVGLSSKVEWRRKTGLVRAGVATLLRLKVHAPYRLDDMALDAVALLDALQIDRAHVVGTSMGGMIAQLLAARWPSRVDRLVLMMTSSGDRRVPQAKLRMRLRMLRRPVGRDRESLIRHQLETLRLIGSPDFPSHPQRVRQRVEQSMQRCFYPRGYAHHLRAILASGSRVKLLAKVTAPTLILHGTRDPLVPVAAAHDLLRRIPGASLGLIPGMGHDFPDALIPRLGSMVIDHLAGVARSSRDALRDAA